MKNFYINISNTNSIISKKDGSKVIYAEKVLQFYYNSFTDITLNRSKYSTKDIEVTLNKFLNFIKVINPTKEEREDFLRNEDAVTVINYIKDLVRGERYNKIKNIVKELNIKSYH